MSIKLLTQDGKLEDTAITVDLEIRTVVLDAATLRLPLVQAEERQKYGKHRTNLSTLAEQILKGWEPGQTKRPPAPGKTVCPTCGREVKTYATGKLRVHGPAGDRCPTAYADDTPKLRKTRPLRFPMNRAEYYEIRDRIHMHGQSVASVITQRLAHFARTGSL